MCVFLRVSVWGEWTQPQFSVVKVVRPPHRLGVAGAKDFGARVVIADPTHLVSSLKRVYTQSYTYFPLLAIENKTRRALIAKSSFFVSHYISIHYISIASV